MYSLYQMAMPQLTLTKIKDGGRGELSELMNGLKSSNKSAFYVIYHGNKLVTSMLNK